MNAIEEKLWEYIDGTLTADEHKAIHLLIETNELYKQKYTELLQLNIHFTAMELDEPSMAFTYNVMESIRAESALKPLKAGVNKYIIGVIGAIFAITILSLLALALKDINWAAPTGDPGLLHAPVKMPQIGAYLNPGVIKGFVCFDIVLGLFLLDSALRKKLNDKHVE